MAVPTMTNNSPSAGYIAWGAFTIGIFGVGYTVNAGSSNQRWVWWEYNGGSPILNAGPDIPASLGADDLVLFGNKNGIGVRVQSANLVDGEMLVDGSIFSDSLSTNLINSTHIVTAGLDASVIKFGTMDGDRIAVNTLSGDRVEANTLSGNAIIANTILTSKLAVADFEMLVPDPYFEDITKSMPRLSTAGVTVVAANDASVPQTGIVPEIYSVAKLPKTYDLFATDNGSGIPVQPGDQFYVDMWVCHTGAETTSLAVRMWVSATGATQNNIGDGGWGYPALATITAASAQDQWIRVTGTITIPALTTAVPAGDTNPKKAPRHAWPALGPGNGAGWMVANWTVRRKNAGVLVVDGSITASKIAADTITANEIATNAITANELAANAVTAVKINAGAVTAGKIAADAVTANEIAAGAITASEIAAHAITANEIASDYVYTGLIVADQIQAGTLTADITWSDSIATGESGARVTIGGDGLTVYDASNNAITHLGTDNESTFTGEVNASRLTLANGQINYGGIMELSGSGSAPAVGPTVTMTKPTSPIPAVTYGVTTGMSQRTLNYVAGTGVCAGSNVDPLGNNGYWLGSFGGYSYWVATTGTPGSNPYITVRKFSGSSLSATITLNYPAPSFGMPSAPAKGNFRFDGTYFYYYAGEVGFDEYGRIEMFRWAAAGGAATLQWGADTPWLETGMMGGASLRLAYIGNGDFGSLRYIFLGQVTYGTDTIVVYNSAGVEQPNDVWLPGLGYGGGDNSPELLIYDGSKFIGYRESTSETTMVNYAGGNNTWSGPASQNWTAAFTYTATSPAAESLPSAISTFAMRKRYTPVLSSPALSNFPGATGVKYYVLNSVTSNKALLKLQTTNPLAYSTSGAAPPTTNSFVTLTPASMKSAAGGFEVKGDGTGAWPFLVPVGAIFPYAGSTAPDGFLLCNGAEYSRTTYSALWDVMRNGGSTGSYGSGNLSTTFNVPNFSNKFPRGGAPSVGGGSTTITAANLPPHSHTSAAHTHTVPNHTHTISFEYITNTANTGTSTRVTDINNQTGSTGGTGDTATTNSTGATTTGSTTPGGTGNGPGTNDPYWQPFVDVQYIIKY